MKPLVVDTEIEDIQNRKDNEKEDNLPIDIQDIGQAFYWRLNIQLTKESNKVFACYIYISSGGSHCSSYKDRPH